MTGLFHVYVMTSTVKLFKSQGHSPVFHRQHMCSLSLQHSVESLAMYKVAAVVLPGIRHAFTCDGYLDRHVDLPVTCIFDGMPAIVMLLNLMVTR